MMLAKLGAKRTQELLNRIYGYMLDEDGIAGMETRRALNQIDQDEFKALIIDLGEESESFFDEPSADSVAGGSLEVKIIEHLKEWEGVKIHWLKGEEGFTSPLGVYSHANPTAEVTQSIKQLFVEYGLSETRENAYKLDEMISNEERELLLNQASSFLISAYMKDEIRELLDENEALVYASISVNGGVGRANKLLQKVLNKYGYYHTSIDGAFGRGSLKALEAFKKDMHDSSQDMLEGMRNFYYYLIEKNPAKYAKFKNGWLNRLNSLARVAGLEEVL